METMKATAATTTAAGLEITRLQDLNTLSDNKYTASVEEALKRPTIKISAELSHETEDYIRIIRTLDNTLLHLRNTLENTHGVEDGRRRFDEIAPLIRTATTAIGADLGGHIVESLIEWEGQYL